MLLLGLFAGTAFGQTRPDRPTLERNYFAWRASVQKKDVRAWEAATSKYRRNTTRNMIISQRHAYPRALFEIPISPPDILQLRCIDERVAGRRAQLIYFGRVDMGVGTPEGNRLPENLLVLHFISEDGSWLFDNMRFVNLAGVETSRAEVAAGNKSFLKSSEFDMPTGDPVVPKLVSYPDHVGHIQVIASGYNAKVKVNGHHCGDVQGTTATHLVIGGFKRGKNQLEVEVERTDLADEDSRYFAINGYVINGAAKQKQVRVFRYRPEEGQPVPKKIRSDIWANAVTIERGQ